MGYPFISFDGLDGTGKSTISQLVTDEIRTKNLPVILIKPGSHIFLPVINASLSEGSEITAMLTFLASMSLASDEAKKHKNNKIIIFDRYYFSTFAYNWSKGVGQNIQPDFFNFLKPDLSILLTANDSKRIKRVQERKNNSPTDFESVSEGSYFWKVEQTLKGFGLLEIDTSNKSPLQIAKVIVKKIIDMIDN